jgi:hypothetical protein
MWRRCIPLPQGELGCRTTRSKNLRQLLSSPAGFSTPRTRLAFSRRHHQPYKCLRRCPRLRRTSIVQPCACRCGRGPHSLSPSVHSHRLIITPFQYLRGSCSRRKQDAQHVTLPRVSLPFQQSFPQTVCIDQRGNSRP